MLHSGPKVPGEQGMGAVMVETPPYGTRGTWGARSITAAARSY
jgi:hypothetical protein